MLLLRARSSRRLDRINEAIASLIHCPLQLPDSKPRALLASSLVTSHVVAQVDEVLRITDETSGHVDLISCDQHS